MRLLPVPAPRSAGRRLQETALLLLPHGGQRAARQNAWRAMVADAAVARARREAVAAVAEASLRSEQAVAQAR
jgi:hypothetical protein